jgi:hypothetical protein
MQHAICETVVQPSGGLATLLWLIGGKHLALTALSMGQESGEDRRKGRGQKEGREEGYNKKQKTKQT